MCAEVWRGLDLGDDWQFAMLAACCVQANLGEGAATGARAPDAKASATEFARDCETTHGRVLRFLDAWDKGAAAGLVPASDTLTPADYPALQRPDIPWRAFMRRFRAGQDPNAGNRLGIALRHATPEQVVAALPAERLAPVAAEVVRVSDPDVFRDVHLAAERRFNQDHADAIARVERTQAEDRAEEKQQHTLRYQDVDVLLDRAKRALGDAKTVATGVRFTDQEHTLLLARLVEVHAALGRLDSVIVGAADDIDWDAEFRKMGES